ncbi:MAG: serine/threonine protein kinase [Amphiamblys sp. WSBS2006]|nr:MAG: serine/threonine protein kinase [Amphiamblys sp. WSBS2006]
MYFFLAAALLARFSYSMREKCSSDSHIRTRRNLFYGSRKGKEREARHVVCEDKIILNGFMSLPRYDKDRIKFVERLAEGGNSTAYAVFDTADNEKYVLKFPRLKKHLGYIREAFAQKLVEHRYVLGVKGFLADGEKDLVLLELASSTLKKLVTKKGLTEKEARMYVSKIIVAIEHMHSFGVYHSDLTYDNVFLGPNGEPLVADFGDCQAPDMGFLTTTERKKSARVNKRVLMGKKEYAKYVGALATRDWVYLGRLTYSIIYGSFQKKDAGVKTIADGFYRKGAPFHEIAFPETPVVSKEAKMFIQKCFSPEVVSFIVPGTVQREPWFSGVNWGNI